MCNDIPLILNTTKVKLHTNEKEIPKLPFPKYSHFSKIVEYYENTLNDENSRIYKYAGTSSTSPIQSISGLGL